VKTFESLEKSLYGRKDLIQWKRKPKGPVFQLNPYKEENKNSHNLNLNTNIYIQSDTERELENYFTRSSDIHILMTYIMQQVHAYIIQQVHAYLSHEIKPHYFS